MAATLYTLQSIYACILSPTSVRYNWLVAGWASVSTVFSYSLQVLAWHSLPILEPSP